MKLRKIILIILLMLININISTQSYAKYVFQYTKKAAEIMIINN